MCTSACIMDTCACACCVHVCHVYMCTLCAWVSHVCVACTCVHVLSICVDVHVVCTCVMCVSCTRVRVCCVHMCVVFTCVCHVCICMHVENRTPGGGRNTGVRSCGTGQELRRCHETKRLPRRSIPGRGRESRPGQGERSARVLGLPRPGNSPPISLLCASEDSFKEDQVLSSDTQGEVDQAMPGVTPACR